MKKSCEKSWRANKKKGTKFAYGRVYNEFWMEVRMKGWMSNRIIKEHTEWNLIKIVKKKGSKWKFIEIISNNNQNKFRNK